MRLSALFYIILSKNLVATNLHFYIVDSWLRGYQWHSKLPSVGNSCTTNGTKITNLLISVTIPTLGRGDGQVVSVRVFNPTIRVRIPPK